MIESKTFPGCRTGAPGLRLLFSRIRHPALCLALIAMGGCASTMAPPPAQAKAPLRITVVQAPMDVDAARLQQVLAPESKRPMSASEEPLLHGASHAQAYADAAMASALAQMPGLSVVSLPAEEHELTARIRNNGLESGITQDEADRLRRVTGADLLLQFRITDYGLTPRAWHSGYIAFEVVTTLAVAAVIAYSSSKAAKAAASVYLVQEAIEETATAYAGFWALDVTCRPVRIEAQLVNLYPVRVVRTTRNTGFSEVHLSRLFRTVSPEERDVQLDQATASAAQGIAADISRSLETGIISRAEK